MIEPTSADIGRKVIYSGSAGDLPGVISSVEDQYVLVQFNQKVVAQAVSRDRLSWADGPNSASNAYPSDSDSDDDMINPLSASVAMGIIESIADAFSSDAQSSSDDFNSGGGDFGGGGSSSDW